jgi:Zn-finger nucleic acid-binding protein
VGDITVDVCRGGCGGVWFDNRELEKVDESFEPADEGLLDVPHDPARTVDHEARRYCPCCPSVVMMRHYFSVRREIEVDECPACGGYFLDRGELAAIRGQFASEEARREAARATFDDLFADQLDEEASRTDEQLARSRRFARMFRVLLPSWWLRGKQPWGAF